MLNKMSVWSQKQTKSFQCSVCSPQNHSDQGQENCNFIFCNAISAELSITLCVVMELVWFYILYYIQHVAIEFHKEKPLCLPWHQPLNTVCRLLMPKTPALGNSLSNWTYIWLKYIQQNNAQEKTLQKRVGTDTGLQQCSYVMVGLCQA